MARPANDPIDLDQTNPVTAKIRNFLSEDVQNTRWKAAIDQLVINAPGIFSSAKGFQISYLGVQGEGAYIRPDLFRILQKHITSVSPVSLVQRTTDVRQGLPDPKSTASFIGLDMLDDGAYGDRYTVSVATAQSFEALIDLASADFLVRMRSPPMCRRHQARTLTLSLGCRRANQ